VLPAQHWASWLQLSDSSLQVFPAGLQCCQLAHRPTVAPANFAHTTRELSCWVVPFGRPSAPQQSVSSRQISPVGRQPLAGWQIMIPLAPKGAQLRLQHEPDSVVVQDSSSVSGS
jgi:hypothetical protein